MFGPAGWLASARRRSRKPVAARGDQEAEILATSQGSDVEILTTVLATDYSSNESSQMATTTIVGIVLAYLGASLFVLNRNDDLPILLVLLLPLPVILLQMLQMTWAVAVIRRAKSAELIEAELMRRTAMASEYSSGTIGSLATTAVTDISHPKARGAMKAVGLTGQLPYYGFYVLTLAFTCFAFVQAATGQHSNMMATADRLTIACFAVLYVILFLIFAIAASVGFGIAPPAELSTPLGGLRPRGLKAQFAVVFVALAGLFLQFVQTEDSTPMFEYFTICSVAAIVIFVPLSMLLNVIALDWLALTGMVGAVVSGIVYIAAIQPVNGLGSDWMMIAANLALHWALPVPAVYCLIFSRRLLSGVSRRARLATLAYPVLYAAIVLTVEWWTGFAGVYQFLRLGNLADYWPYLVGFAVLWCAVASLDMVDRRVHEK